MVVTNEGQQQSVKFIVDTERCCGCKRCLRRCMENVWHWNEDEKCSVPKYPDECVLCLQCEMDCLNNCIDVIPLVTLKVDPLYYTANTMEGGK